MLFNQWTGVGHVGQNPKTTRTSTGQAMTTFRLAVYQGKGHPPMWLNILAWEGLAERAKDFRTGQEVLIQGRLELRTSQDKHGKVRPSLNLIATSAQLTQKPSGAPSKDDVEDASACTQLALWDGTNEQDGINEHEEM